MLQRPTVFQQQQRQDEVCTAQSQLETRDDCKSLLQTEWPPTLYQVCANDLSLNLGVNLGVRRDSCIDSLLWAQEVYRSIATRTSYNQSLSRRVSYQQPRAAQRTSFVRYDPPCLPTHAEKKKNAYRVRIVPHQISLQDTPRVL